MRKHLSLLAIVLVAASLPVAGQVRQKPGVTQSNDGEAAVLENEVDPNPFDPKLEIRDYFRQHLPTTWWFTDPAYGTNVWSVTVHIPDNWRGNPTSAIMQLCPDRFSPIWQESLDRILVHAFYRKRPWPGVECRREHFLY